jgi:hypothetical protein
MKAKITSLAVTLLLVIGSLLSGMNGNSSFVVQAYSEGNETTTIQEAYDQSYDETTLWQSRQEQTDYLSEKIKYLTSPVETSSDMISTTAAVTPGMLLEDGQTYYIKNQKSGIHLDVATSGNVANVIQYYWHGGNNQMFKLKRISSSIYEIIPMHDQGKRVDISGASTANDANVQSYKSNSTNAQRFKIVDDGFNTGSYKILTAVSNYTKCITVLGASTASGANVIQYTYDASKGTNNNDHWYFEKVSNISIYNELDCYIGKDAYNYFNLSFQNNINSLQSVYYCYETTGSNDPIISYWQNGKQLDEDDDSGPGSNSKLIFRPLAANGRQIRVRLFGSRTGTCKLRFYPRNDVFFNSYNVKDDINTVADISDVVGSLNAMGNFVNNETNVTRAKMLGATWNSPTRFNNDFYFISSHGSTGGTAWLSGGDTYAAGNLPDMSSVQFAVFAICYGGAVGNLADLSVANHNVNAALGWPGLTYVLSSRTFTTKLWSEVANGKTYQNAVDSAKSHTSWTYWFNLGIWGDNTIMDPKTYGNVTDTSPSANSQSASKMTTNSNLNMGNVVTSNQNELDTFLNNNQYVVYEDMYNLGYVRYVRTIDEMPTNEYSVVNYNANSGTVCKSTITLNSHEQVLAKNIIKNVSNSTSVLKSKIAGNIVLEQDFCIKTFSGVQVVRRIQYKYVDSYGNETLDEMYFNVSTGVQYDTNFIVDCFN